MSESNHSTFTLGITGGIGSGKSLVCEIFEDLGARVLYADVEAKRLMVENREVKSEIIHAFGEESYLPDGNLNRSYLARIVFGDEEEIARINSIVHPRMAKVFYDARATAIDDDIPLLVYEAALIYESGSAERLDAVAVVHAPATLRIKRVMERDDVTAEDVESRMQHQLPEEELLRRADYVIENDGSIEALEERVEDLFYDLCP